MRRVPLAALLASLLAASCAQQANTRGAVAGSEDRRPRDGHPIAHPDIAAARELDQEGVRSYVDGRYADAVRLFRAAYLAGGPPSELWNIVRSREKLDDPEGAAKTIEEYLAQEGLAQADRAEAEH